MLPLARHLQARPLQGGNHRGAIRDGPRFDALAQIVGNQPPGVFLRLQPSPKLGGFDVGPMAGLHVPRPLRIVRTAPAVLVVLPVPQRVKRLLPSGSRDIQALAGLKIAARRQDMHVDTPARFAVLDRCPGVAVRFQPRPGGFLELVQHAANLRIARFVLRCPRDDARRVLVLELKRIGHVGHLVRIAPQHFDFFRVLLRVPVLILVLILFGGEVLLAGEVVRCRRCRPGSASEKLDHHRGSPSTVKVSSARSMATRCAATSSASAFSLWILAQRAIWFRFAPIRASSRVRFRSSSACATVQVRTRPTDRRTRSDSDNPTERALPCHSARSASLALIFTQTARRAPMMLLSPASRMGVEGGKPPRQSLPGITRSVAPKGSLTVLISEYTCARCPLWV